jgi:hypothetical protein
VPASWAHLLVSLAWWMLARPLGWRVQEARGLRDVGLVRGGSFAAILQEWVAGEGSLSAQAAQTMATDAERLLKSSDRSAWQRSSFRHKALLFVLLAGDRRIAEHLLRVRPAPACLPCTVPFYAHCRFALSVLPIHCCLSAPSSLASSTGST